MSPPRPRLPKTLVLDEELLMLIRAAVTNLTIARGVAASVANNIRAYYDAHGDAWQDGHGEYLVWLNYWDRAEADIAQALAAIKGAPTEAPSDTP